MFPTEVGRCMEHSNWDDLPWMRSKTILGKGDPQLRTGRFQTTDSGTTSNRPSTGFSVREPITIDDDDDHHHSDPIQISSSRTLVEGVRTVSHWRSNVEEDDLELRLGFREYRRETIHIADDREDMYTNLGKLDKILCANGLNNRPVNAKVNLVCTICMDTMKEETSTVCGHVFCHSCITSAIKLQKKCPTCRRKLSTTSIHRIYLPGTS